MSDTKKKILEKINIKFKDESLFDLALTHRSYVHEKKWTIEKSNERLEFLGDAVLGLCIADLLVKNFPEEPEGILSKRRAALVNQKQLASIATQLELGAALKLGKGEEKTGGREKKSLLCDAYEALIGALYIDQGISVCRRYIEKVFSPLMPDSKDVKSSKDYKTRLQEHFQSEFRRSPKYSVIKESGPDHSKLFEVQIEFQGDVIAQGKGSSKREAEQSAAERAFELLKLGEKGPEPKRKRKRKKRTAPKRIEKTSEGKQDHEKKDRRAVKLKA